MDFKEILKGLLQQLINSNFIQNFHKLQVHIQHNITLLLAIKPRKTNNQSFHKLRATTQVETTCLV